MIVLAVHDDGERRLRVIELLDDRSRAYLEGDALYTHIDQDGDSLLAYVETMRAALAGSARVLLLGTAGGALATALSRRGTEVTAVDDMAWAFTAARRWFHLPNQIECVHADALAFLRNSKRRWNGIAIDVFCGLEIPDRFMTAEFGALLLGALEPGGVLVWNVADDPLSSTVAWVARAMRDAGLVAEAIQVSADEYSNTVVVCRASA
jgi:spermidine synthase